MNKYKKVEELLYNYKMLKISIENMKEDIEYLDKEDGLKGISYDGTSTSKTNDTSDIVADVVLSKSEKRHYLEHQIECNQREIDSIDRAMEGLTDIERKIITEKYINSNQWWQVASKVCYSESWCKQLRGKAINKLIIGVYGSK